MVSRKEIQSYLSALEKPFPKETSGTDGNGGLNYVITCAGRVSVRVDKGQDTSTLVVFQTQKNTRGEVKAPIATMAIKSLSLIPATNNIVMVIPTNTIAVPRSF